MTSPDLTKLLVIGLDSADYGLIDHWGAAGELPALYQLVQSSIVAQVENPKGMESGSVWPTFQTGVSPARHRQYDALRVFDPKAYEHRFLGPEEMSPHYFWNHLSDNGKRVCLIDAMMVQRPKLKDGIVIHDWGPHVPGQGGTILKFWTSPAELGEEIKTRFGLDALDHKMCDIHKPRTAQAQATFRDGLVDQAKRKGDMAAWLLKQGNWDLFYVTFSEAHCAGHHCWHLHDPTHPEFDQAVADKVGNPLLDVYRSLDRAVANLIETAGPNVPAIVYCSHGMAAEYSGTRMLDRLLVALEGGAPRDMRSPGINFLRNAWRSLPGPLKDQLRSVQNKAYRSMLADGFQPNRRNRRYFEVYLNNRSAGVRINLKGRESNGLVEPGTAYDQLLDEITQDLLAFTNVETGEPLVDKCVPLNRELEGKFADNLPDLSVTWNTNAPIRRVHSPKTGEIINEQLTYRSGDHRPVGQMMAQIPGTTPKRLNEPIKAEDFVPTFYELLGLPPTDSDGSAIKALISG